MSAFQMESQTQSISSSGCRLIETLFPRWTNRKRTTGIEEGDPARDNRGSEKAETQNQAQVASNNPDGPNEQIQSLDLDFNDPWQWIMKRHRENLIYRVTDSPPSKLKGIYGLDCHYRMNLAELQRVHLRKLQCKLVDHIVGMRFRQLEPEPVNWEEDLANYVKAMRDYDYMLLHAKKAKDPFYVTAERITDNEVMQAALIHEDPDDLVHLKKWHKIEPWEPGPDPEGIGGARSDVVKKSWWENFQDRLWFAFFGGAFLLAPMWIMILHNTLYTGLATTTAFVAVFGLILSVQSDDKKDVLSSTAAYAAVLVVFVGVNTDSGS